MSNKSQSQQKLTDPSKAAKLEVIDVSLPKLDSQHLWGCHIDRPQNGDRIDSDNNNEIEIMGWVLGKSSRSVAVEIISEEKIIQRVPIDRQRPGVAKAYPHVGESKNSGFSTKVELTQEVLEREMLLQAVLEDESRIPIGKIGISPLSPTLIRRVYIRGCPRSGNTLMLYLCGTGFKNSYILEPEQVPFPEVSPPDKITFGKIPRPEREGKEILIRADNFLAEADGAVIFMMRDPRDVLLSEHGLKPGQPWLNNPSLWIKNALFCQKLENHPRFVLVKYEELLTKPNEIQEKIATALGLDIAIAFTECWQHFQPDRSNSKALKGVRALDTSRIGNWKQNPEQIEYIKNKFRSWPDILPLMKHFGYEVEDVVDNFDENISEQTTEIARQPTVDIADTPIIKKYNLSICGIMKDEGPYLVEWLEFHKLVGVERFYLYDNSSSDNTINFLRPYIECGEVIYYYWPHKPGQMSAYIHCLKNHKSDSEWIAFIDLDEFLFPTVADKITDIIDEFSDVSALGVNWLNFGTSGHEKKPEGLQIENFIKRAKKSFGPNKHIKCILRPEKTVRSLNPHQFVFSQGQVVTENKQPINGPISSTHSIKKIRINHYSTRSKEESMKKMMRGRATKNEQRPWSHFESKDKIFNEVEDLTIQRFVPRLKIAVEKIQRQVNKEQFLSAKPQTKSNKYLATVGNLNKVAIEDQLLLLNGWVVSLKYGSADSFKVSIGGTEITNFQQIVAIPSPDVQKVHRQLKGVDKARFRIKVPLEQQQLEEFQDSLVIVTPVFEGNEGAALLGVLNPTIKTPKKEYIKQFAGTPNQFSNAAFKWLGYSIEIAGLKPTDRVLELGCSIGKVAYALVNYLKPIAGYEGIDFREKVLSWPQQEITTRRPHLNFRRENVHHPIYNPTGTVPGVEFVLPYHNFSFDVVCVTDLFTHLQISEMRHYLEEVHRVLKSGGRLLFGCFLLNPESEKLIAQGQASQKLVHEIEGGLTLDLELPEKGIGFSESLLLSLVEECGLRVVGKYYGFWCGRKSFINQDLLVLQKKTQLSLENETELKQTSSTKADETQMFKSKLDNYPKILEQYKSRLEKIQVEIDALTFKNDQS